MFKTPSIAIIATLIYAPTFADTPKFGEEATVAVLSTLTLGTDQTAEFAKFSEKPRYFGAFYINPFGGQSFRVSDYGSLKAARETAENRCNTDASPAKCQLYAVSVPKGQDAKSDDLVGFSQGATIDFNEDYLTHQNEGRFGAFAISKGVSYGYTWDWNSQAEAEASALLFCESDMLEDLAKVYIVEREFSRNAGYTSCKIAHSYSSN